MKGRASTGGSGFGGDFDRTLSVPIRIEPDAVTAEYRNGVLALFIPRAESDKPRAIAIN